jgi:hypothetical protein
VDPWRRLIAGVKVEEPDQITYLEVLCSLDSALLFHIFVVCWNWRLLRKILNLEYIIGIVVFVP